MTVAPNSISYPYFLISQFVLVICAIGGSWVAASATNNATEKDYVTLAITMLQSPDSPQAQREWAADVLSSLSPVDIPAGMKVELVTGRSHLPIDCIKRLRTGPIFNYDPVTLKDVVTVGDVVDRAVMLKAELEIAEARLEAIKTHLSLCDGTHLNLTTDK